jgi:hypothetical protein
MRTATASVPDALSQRISEAADRRAARRPGQGQGEARDRAEARVMRAARSFAFARSSTQVWRWRDLLRHCDFAAGVRRVQEHAGSLLDRLSRAAEDHRDDLHVEFKSVLSRALYSVDQGQSHFKSPSSTTTTSRRLRPRRRSVSAWREACLGTHGCAVPRAPVTGSLISRAR